MGNAIVDNAYYDWLMCEIEYDQGDIVYDNVFNLMFNTEFRWTVANDDNRAADGIQLRYMFMEEEGWNTEPLEGEPCNVLEMLIALAKRMEDDIMWDGEEDRSSIWFWDMINNLEFARLPESEFEKRINEMLDRTYEQNGYGGLFPLRKWSGIDQRKVEIWYQAQSYLMENNDF